MISKELVGQILEPIIFQRKRGGVSKFDFHHLVRSVLQVSNPEGLIKVAIEMINMDFTVDPEDRAPGTPGSIPFYTRQASHNIRIYPFLYKTGKPLYKKGGDIYD